MSPERWQQIEQLYHAALERAPAGRAAFLQQACAGDEALRREVESLLASHDQAASFIETPPDDIAAEIFKDKQTNVMLGRTLGHYELGALLGAGGMGEVYRARDTRLDREVAVKILPTHLAEDAEALRRFEREAKAVAALSHQNILAIFDFGAEEKLSYAVMELLEGETLRARLKHSALSWREAVEIGAAVAEGLAAAHAKGIIHRDLKPENIFLTADGGVKILDFGIARVKRTVLPDAKTLTAETTQPGIVMGTLGYMSPEQVRGKEVEAPSDIFSLGCVLYEMVSGQRPFSGETGAEVIAAILKEEPPELTKSVKQMPRELARVIQQCLEKRPEQRYQTARALAADLKSLLAEREQTGRALRRARYSKRGLVAVAAALFLLAVIVLALYRFAGRAPAIDSLAVLPLVNASGDANTEYLSDGITEALINSLSQLPQLKRVIARSTVASYKSKEIDPRRVGQELNVRALLIGQMMQRGADLVINAELVNTADGARLWGDQYSRKLADILGVQEEIAQRISERLRLRLSGEEQKRLTKHYTNNAEAYQLYLKGRYYSNKFTADGFKKGIEFMNQAVTLDPTYALAHAGLAASYYDASGLYFSPKEAMPKVKVAVLKALELDESLVEAHTTLGLFRAQYEGNWAEAEKEYKQALNLNQGYAPVHQCYAYYLAEQGRMEEAIARMKRARELDPLTSYISSMLGFYYYLARRPDEAITESRQVIDMNPEFATAYFGLGLAYRQKGMLKEALAAFNQARVIDPENPYPLVLLGYTYAIMGKRDEAQKILDELERRAKQRYIDPIYLAKIYSGLGEKDQAFALLEKAFDIRSEELLFLKVEPIYDGLRADPRYANLLRRLNLSP